MRSRRVTASRSRPPAVRQGSAATWVVGILLVVLLVILGGFWWVRENPLALYEKTTRQALAEAGFEMRTFDSSVGKLAYWEAGDGPLLVVVHGVGDQAGAFHAVVAGLLDDYRVVIPDLPGHGASEPGTGPLPMDIVYDGLEELLAHLVQKTRATLVGSSMGAWLAMVQAHRHPETVERIVAINGGALLGDPTDLTLTPADRAAARTLMAALRDPSSDPVPDFVLDDIVERAAEGPIGRMMAEWASFEEFLLDGRLEEITVPVDLLWGESDRLMTVAYAERMLSQLPRARLTTIAACGHHPANECPEKLLLKLEEVLVMAPPAAPPADEEAAGSEGPLEGEGDLPTAADVESPERD